jgi:hypothetical protein
MKRFIALIVGLALGISLAGFGHVYAGKGKGPPDPAALCQSQRLNALTIYAKKVFYCWAQAAKAVPNPDSAACVRQAFDELDSRWSQTDPGVTGCGSDVAVAELVEWIGGNGVSVGAADEIVQGVVAGPDGLLGTPDDVLDLTNPQARNLADGLLKAAGQKVFTLLKAYSQNVHKPNEGKLQSTIAKASAKFTKAWEKDVAKADKKSVDLTLMVMTVEEAEGIIDLLAQNISLRIQGQLLTLLTITASAGSDGTIDPLGAVTVSYGGEQTFTITAGGGFVISEVTVDGTAITPTPVSPFVYDFANVISNHTIVATFAASAPPL